MIVSFWCKNRQMNQSTVERTQDHIFSQLLHPGVPGAQMVKNPPAVWETWVQPLGWEDPLEKGKATHSSILAWRILWTEEAGGLQSVGSQSRM